MAYTFEELQKMGAKPVTPKAPAANAVAPTMSAAPAPAVNPASSTPAKKKYTPDELMSLGAKPVEAKRDVKGGLVGEILTGSTQRFGKTIGESLAAPGNAEMYADAMQGHSKLQNDLNKRIKEKREKGEDTSRLERALIAYVEDTPKLEDFTGEVINKKGSEIAGEALGTALEIVPFGTYGKATKGMKSFQVAEKTAEKTVVPTVVKATKDLITQPSKFLTKEGGKQVLEGAGFGYGLDVSQGLQGQRGEDRTGGNAAIPGLGTAIGAVAPIAIKAAGVGVKAGANKIQTTLAERAERAAGEADHLIGTIIQGEAKDIPAARRAFGEIETSGVKTYSDLKDALNTKIKAGAEKKREALGFEPYVKSLDELALKTKVGDVEVSHNFVNDAMDQLDNFYKKTGNIEESARINQLRQKAQTQGLSIQEVDDLAIRHGRDLNGFNANGELASGLGKQMAENTRKGLKRTAREQFNSPLYNETDGVLSDLIKTRDLVEETEAAVLKLQQKTRHASLGERIGMLAEQVLNFTTFGTSRGFLQSGRDLGLFKTQTSMTALELEKRLAKNLKRLLKITDGQLSEGDMIKNLESFLMENKVMPTKPPKLNKSPKVFTPSKKTAQPTRDLEKGNSKKPTVRPGKLEKPKKNKGSASLKGLIGGTGLSGAAVLANSNTEEYTAPEREASISAPEEMSSEKIGQALYQLESSGGKNKASADKGEKKWVTGLTDVAIRELKRLGRISDSFDKSDEEEVIQASVEYFKLMQERNPDLTPGEVYVDKYWTQWNKLPNPKRIREKKIAEFNQLVMN